jgi:GT2 family glycosyltransferase
VTPEISIIIPVLSYAPQRNLRYSYLRDSGIRQLLESIRDNVSLPHETIVVVNNGDDQDLQALVRDPSLVTKYCVNSVNVGVARAWNMGAMMAEGEILCWSNDDVVVGKGAIERLVEVLRADPRVGEVGPHGGLRYLSGPKAGQCERMIGKKAIEEAHEISGYFFLTKRHVFEEVGPFDNSYTPCFFEEIDYSFAVRAGGYKCLVVPGIEIAHRKMHGVSAKRTTVEFFDRAERTDAITERNHAYFVRKWKLV